MRHPLRAILGATGLLVGLSCAFDAPSAPSAPIAPPHASLASREDEDENRLDDGRDEHHGSRTAVPVTCTPRRAQSGTAMIGPSGGVLRVGDNFLVVPGGAVLEPVEISGEVPAGSLAAIRLQPEGLRFRKPAQLVLSADGCALREQVTRVVYLDEEGTVLEEIVAEFFPRFKTVAAPISHFSIYAVATLR